MVGEGGEGEVSGEGVPPGDEGGFSQPVPEHSHPLPVSPKTHSETAPAMTKRLSPSVTHSTQPCDKASVRVVTRSITLLAAFYKKESVCFPLRIRHKTLNINAFAASGHIQNSNNI